MIHLLGERLKEAFFNREVESCSRGEREVHLPLQSFLIQTREPSPSSPLNLFQMPEHHPHARILSPLPPHVLSTPPWDNPVNDPILIVYHMEQNILHAVEARLPVPLNLCPRQVRKLVRKPSPNTGRVGVEFRNLKH